MKKCYSTNLFYRYTVVTPDRQSINYTESKFYEKLYSYKEFKFKKYADREETKTKDGYLFIRFYAYLDVEDYVEVSPFHYPEEIKPCIPDVKTNIEDPIFWHNIKNHNLGRN